MIKIKEVKQEGNQLIITANAPDAQKEDLLIYMNVDAIGSRMVLYNLSTPEEALKAVVLEHARRFNADLPNSENKEQMVDHYQKDKKVKVDIVGADKVSALLEENLERIQQAVVDRMPEEARESVNE
jgi:hypothetical protein